MTETSYQPPRDMSTLVLAWIRRARESQIRHYTMADRLTRCGRRLGLAVHRHHGGDGHVGVFIARSDGGVAGCARPDRDDESERRRARLVADVFAL